MTEKEIEEERRQEELDELYLRNCAEAGIDPVDNIPPQVKRSLEVLCGVKFEKPPIADRKKAVENAMGPNFTYEGSLHNGLVDVVSYNP